MSPSFPLGTKLAYGLGDVAVMIAKQAPMRLSFPIYHIGLGVTAAWIGTLFSFMRICDGIRDPLIGHRSDRCSSRYGRRKPFMMISLTISGILMASALVGSLHCYINIYYLQGGDSAAASTAIGWFWTAVSGVASRWYLYTAEMPSDKTIGTMRFIFSAVPGAIFFVIFVVMVFYPRPKPRMLRIRQSLAARKQPAWEVTES